MHIVGTICAREQLYYGRPRLECPTTASPAVADGFAKDLGPRFHVLGYFRLYTTSYKSTKGQRMYFDCPMIEGCSPLGTRVLAVAGGNKALGFGTLPIRAVGS